MWYIIRLRRDVLGMNSIIIIVSVLSLSMLINRKMKEGLLSYLISVFVSTVYAILLFYVGFTISDILFLILSILPIILILIDLYKDKKKI